MFGGCVTRTIRVSQQKEPPDGLVSPPLWDANVFRTNGQHRQYTTLLIHKCPERLLGDVWRKWNLTTNPKWPKTDVLGMLHVGKFGYLCEHMEPTFLKEFDEVAQQTEGAQHVPRTFYDTSNV